MTTCHWQTFAAPALFNIATLLALVFKLLWDKLCRCMFKYHLPCQAGKYWSCNCPEASMLLIRYWTRSEILPNRNKDLPIGRQRIWFAYLVPSLGIPVTKMQISDLLIPTEGQMTWNGRKVWSFIRSLLGQSDYTGLSCQFLERLVACET